jgi:murein L,D-transpeptidase YcbB/YkuD
VRVSLRKFPVSALALAFGVLSAGLAVAQAPTPAKPPRVLNPPAPSAPSLNTFSLRPAQIITLKQALADAGSHGLKPEEFNTDDIEQQLAARDPAQRRAGELRLMAMSVLYAQAVHAGRLPVDQFMREWGLRPPAYDATTDFAQALAADRLGSWLDSLPPPYSGYQSLRDGLRLYRRIADQGGWPTIPGAAGLKSGMSDPRVVTLRARLAAEDSTVEANTSPRFDDDVAQGVMRAQKRFGLEPTGVVNAATLAALNIPVEDRVGQIEANMERWRWMPPELPADRIQVNIAAAVLTMYRADAPLLSMRAVTGRPGDETPMLQSVIHSVVINPPWNVPYTIATKELWPKERAHPGYFKANDIIVIPTEGGGNRLQQKAGPKAALGKFKFDFPNTYGVYLHDTPTHTTFSRYGRLASHGCVRLEKPDLLAKTVLAGDAIWTPESIDATLESGETVRAPLAQPITVLLFYWTAYMAPDGQVNFRQDPYGWDQELVRRLAALPLGSA